MTLEITKLANGYMVEGKSFTEYDAKSWDDIYVFNDIEHLFAHLRTEFDEVYESPDDSWIMDFSDSYWSDYSEYLKTNKDKDE